MRNRCSKISRLLGAYIDKELSSQKMKAIEAHLHQCGACSLEVKLLQKTRTLIKLSGPEEVSQEVWADYWPQVHKRLIRPRPLGLLRLHPRIVISTSVAAAVILMVFVSNLVFFGEKSAEVISTIPGANRCIVESIECGNPKSTVALFTTEKSNIKIIWGFNLEDSSRTY